MRCSSEIPTARTLTPKTNAYPVQIDTTSIRVGNARPSVLCVRAITRRMGSAQTAILGMLRVMGSVCWELPKILTAVNSQGTSVLSVSGAIS